jgi:enoyl-CoA hydratase/carnithine racemase
MTERAVLLDIDGPLARITLNRPERLNAINLAWCHDLEAAVQAVAGERDVRVVVIQGAGRSFCSGLDRDMMEQEGMPPDFFESHERAFRGLELMDKLVLAALHGHVLGGGLQLAVACDLRICSTDARLGLPAVQDGLIPGMATYRLPRLIGLGPARRLIFSGQIIEPDEAFRLGLVDHLVPAERFADGVEALVAGYVAAPHTATIASKRLTARALEAPLETVYQEALPLLAECLASPEAAAAREAWRERRTSRLRP